MLMKKPKTDKPFLMLSPQEIRLNPNQPRRIFDGDAMEQLKASISQCGIIQPLVVRACAGGYELIAGERRLNAAKALGLEGVPCFVRTTDSAGSCFLAVTENLQRQDLSFFEQAQALDRLITYYNYTQQEAADKLGVSQSTVANKLRLLRLSRAQRERIENMQLTERHARALLRLIDDGQRDAVLNEIIVKGLNAEQTDRYVDKLLEPEPHRQTNKFAVRDVRLFVNSINRAIEVMKFAGIRASSEKSETDNYIQYVVTIPKPGCEVRTATRFAPTQAATTQSPPTQSPPTQAATTQAAHTQAAHTQAAPTQAAITQAATTQAATTQAAPTQSPLKQAAPTEPISMSAGNAADRTVKQSFSKSQFSEIKMPPDEHIEQLNLFG